MATEFLEKNWNNFPYMCCEKYGNNDAAAILLLLLLKKVGNARLGESD